MEHEKSDPVVEKPKGFMVRVRGNFEGVVSDLYARRNYMGYALSPKEVSMKEGGVFSENDAKLVQMHYKNDATEIVPVDVEPDAVA